MLRARHDRPRCRRAAEQRDELAAFHRSPRRRGRAPAMRGMGFMERGAPGRLYSGLMFAARITLPHFSVSSTMSWANSVVDCERGVSPRSAIRSVILASE